MEESGCLGQGGVGILQEGGLVRPCETGVVAERAPEAGAGAHHHALVLRKRPSRIQPPDGRRNGRRVEQGSEGV